MRSGVQVETDEDQIFVTVWVGLSYETIAVTPTEARLAAAELIRAADEKENME